MKAAHVVASIFAFTLFILLPLECLLRFLPPPRYNINWIYDPVIGHRGPRNQLVRLPINVTTQYNSYGYRGDDPTPRETRRDHFSVFVLGDSITEAVQVPWRRSFTKRLEYLLTEKLGRDAEVTAFAVSDYGTTNELLVYAKEAKAQKPDVVVLQFLGLNDFVNNGIGFADKNKAMSDFARPYLIPKRLEGKLKAYPLLGEENPFTYLNPTWKSWRESIRLLSYFDFFKTTIAWKKKREILLDEPSSDFCATEVEVFLDQPDERWQDSFEVTGRMAELLQTQVDLSESSQKGVPPRLIAVYAPSYFEVYDPAWEKGVELSLMRCFQKSYHRENPEKRFLELFRKAGVETYSLKEDFKRSPLPIQKLYLPDGHFSSEGHALAAQSLFRLIAQKPPASARQR